MKLGMIGHFDPEHKIVCGQSDRTEIIYNSFKERLGEGNVVFINSHGWKKSVFSILKSIITIMSDCDIIVFLLSTNGVKAMYRVLPFLNIFYKKKIYQIIIGGSNNIEIFKNNRYCLKNGLRISGLFVEAREMVSELKKIGFTKVYWAPNCKKIRQISDTKHIISEDEPIRFCTYSRINISKGIPDAIDAIAQYNETHVRKCELDIYGIVDSDYEKEFNEKTANTPNVHVKGKINRADSIDILSQYFALLFPTHHNEGVPGALIDSYEAGLPIIACNSAYMSDLIKQNQTGLLYSSNNKNGLRNAVEYAINNVNAFVNMRKNCIEEAKKYDETQINESILKNMGLF